MSPILGRAGRSVASGIAASAAFLALLVLVAVDARATTIQRVVSPGGIEAWLVEENTVPLIAFNFAFAGGSSQDPAGKAGLANLVSGLIDEGAGELDSKAFQERLSDLSMRLSFTAGRDWFYGSMRTLSQNRDEAFELLRVALNDPRFDADPVEKIRAQIIARLKRNARDPEAVASHLWFKTAFPGHPYGRPTDGTEESVGRIERGDIVNFHKSVFTRQSLKIGVVGAIDAKTLAPLLDELFGALPSESSLAAIADTAPATGETVNRDMTIPQTIVQFGGVGLKRTDPDFVPAYVANFILGGGSFSSRLYTEVREKRGLAYSVYSYLAPYEHAGIFVGGLSTRADRAGEALKIVRGEIARIASEGPSEDELARAKSFLTGSYALRFDTSGKIARQLVAIQIDDLGIDYINRRNSLIEAVTIDDVRRAAKRVFGTGLLITTVGPPDA